MSNDSIVQALKKLVPVAVGKVDHSFNGACPDDDDYGVGWKSRDPECPACKRIVAAEKVIAGAK